MDYDVIMTHVNKVEAEPRDIMADGRQVWWPPALAQLHERQLGILKRR
jgi:hypothetical protein